MAETYTIVSQRLTHEVVGGHDLRDVWEIGAETYPHRIYFAFRVAPDKHTPAQVAAEADDIARGLEQLRQLPAVEGVAYVQDYRPDGRLADEIEVFYRTPDGRHRGTLKVPLHGANVGTITEMIDGRVAHLDSIAGL